MASSSSPQKPPAGNSLSTNSTNGKLDGPSKNGRGARRKRAREAKYGAEAEVDLSRSSHVENAEAGPSQPLTEGATGFGAEDFIAFDLPEEENDESEKEKQAVVEEQAMGDRVGDKGKGRARDNGYAGRKRKSDEIDYNDGYASKKERIDANTRRAPWAADVDWDNCHNVAEMCVICC